MTEPRRVLVARSVVHTSSWIQGITADVG